MTYQLDAMIYPDWSMLVICALRVKQRESSRHE
jgi:hypothetical protein